MSEINKLKKFFLKSFDYKTQILIRVAFIGVVIGLTTALLRLGTDSLEAFIYQLHFNTNHWMKWLILPFFCTLGGLFAGVLTHKIAPDAQGSGIPQVKYVLSTSGSEIKLRTVVIKFFSAILAIGTGFSLGREGPTVQIGAGIASKINTVFGRTQRKSAIASGAGAGLAAAFNTPIAGVLFVTEELDKDFANTSLGPAIVASVAAVFTVRMICGDFFVYDFQNLSTVSIYILPLFVLLGILTSIFGTYFHRSLLWSPKLFSKYFFFMPVWSWGAIAGLVTGIAGIWIPEALGSGHNTLEQVLAGKQIWLFIPIIFLAKYLLTVIAYGSRVPGGFFAPSLILGALLGDCFGKIFALMFPSLGIEPAAFAFVGMGAFFTSISRAPITSIVMLFELTGNYHLILPLMFGCIVANISAEKLKHGSVYENLLEREGLRIKESTTLSYLQKTKISQVMTSKIQTVNQTMTLTELHELMDRSQYTGFPVVNSQDKLVGIVTQSNINDAFDKELDLETEIKEVMSKNLITLSPEDSIHSAILKLYENQIGRVLIVSDEDQLHLLGIITRSDIINFEASRELDS